MAVKLKHFSEKNDEKMQRFAEKKRENPILKARRHGVNTVTSRRTVET